jgi:uncharacterized protein YggE
MCGMQMVERPWGVAAYGAASVKAVPDLVRVRFKVIRLEKTPAESFARASDSVHAVREVLRGHRVPDGGVERSRLGLKSAWSYTGSRREFLGYACTAAFAVQSGDLDDVQQLLVDLVGAGANEIEGVDFDVAGKPAMRAGARRKAVSAARDKAALYAEHARDPPDGQCARSRVRGGHTCRTGCSVCARRAAPQLSARCTAG